MVFIIASVLEPLLTNSIRNASFNQEITAGKLLARYIIKSQIKMADVCG